MNNVSIEIEIVKDLPVDKIKKYADLVVLGVARQTKDYTNSDSRFPRLTGNLQNSSMAQEVRKEQDYVYCLDVPGGANYARYVWEFPQETNWTNPNTYAQWYNKVYSEKKETITKLAIDNALRSIK